MLQDDISIFHKKLIMSNAKKVSTNKLKIKSKE